MWPFNREAQDVVEPTPPKRQRIRKDVLDKLLFLIHTRHVEVQPDSKRGGRCVVDSAVDIVDDEGIMTIVVNGSEFTVYRRFDIEFDIICDALNQRLKELKGKAHSVALSISPTDAFNEGVMKL
jgi:hypothetical protein